MARRKQRNRNKRRSRRRFRAFMFMAIALVLVLVCLVPIATLAIQTIHNSLALPTFSTLSSQSTYSVDSSSLQAGVSGQTNASTKPKAPKLPKIPKLTLPPGVVQRTTVNAWAQAGAIAYKAAASTMKNRNGEGQGLDDFQKQMLRPYFGKLVDRVKVAYDAQMLDRWEVDNQPVMLSNVETAAQAFCDRIYVKDSYISEDISQLILLAHEMVHIQQCQDLGGLEQFGFTYFKEYKLANQVYRQNRLEVEAFEFQKEFARTLGYN
jgi:hypothetical protein